MLDQESFQLILILLDSLNNYQNMFIVIQLMTIIIQLILFVLLITYVCSQLPYKTYGPIVMELLRIILITFLTQILPIIILFVYVLQNDNFLLEIFP